jgi:hypothetical protein
VLLLVVEKDLKVKVSQVLVEVLLLAIKNF